MPKFTSKGAITALILVAVAIAAGVFISDRAGPPNTSDSVASDSATPVSAPRKHAYTEVGHQDDALSGPAFSAPGANPTLKPAGWEQQPVIHPPEAGEVDLAVTLDQQIHDMLLPEVQAFAREQGITIAINRGTCGVSATQLGKKQADVGGFCCPPGVDDRLPGLRYHTLGIGAIALLIHPDNPLESLTRGDARKVFGWHLRRWNELPSVTDFDQAITPITRLHCKSRPGHWTLLLRDESLFSPTIQDAGSIGYLIGQVARYPDAIGYETLFWVDHHGQAVKALRVDDIAPSDLDALAAGAYPFFRTFNLTTWQDAGAKPLAQALTDHLMRVVERGRAKRASRHLVRRALAAAPLPAHATTQGSGHRQGQTRATATTLGTPGARLARPHLSLAVSALRPPGPARRPLAGRPAGRDTAGARHRPCGLVTQERWACAGDRDRR